ncbi:hypothetical protein AB0H71_04040 [Nocardia sp. NPDC050697]|uniref:hypothetical protein n=1 Tax=Nocardia sp. NPDC050697 TaxID=3155158 RepID=UPI0033C7F8A3
MTAHRFAPAALALGLAATVALGVSGCGKSERWCERDQGDVLVANSYCEANTPGYEWEPDHDKPKKKKKPIKKKH